MRGRKITVLAALLLAVAGPAAAAAKPKTVTFAAAVAVPKSGLVRASVALDTRKTTVPKGDRVASYSVQYGDGSRTVTGKGLPHLSHRYSKPGSYTIALSLTDAKHKTSTAKAKIKIVAVPPVVVAPQPTAPAPTPPPAPVPTAAPSPTTAPAPTTSTAPTSAPPSATGTPSATDTPSAAKTATAAPAHPATSLAIGADFACAVVMGGHADCWGENTAGELGDGSTTSREQPEPVTSQGQPLANVTQLAAGASHVCALIEGGAVDCWGYNGDGQLGDGTQVNEDSPKQVPGLSGVTAIAAGDNFTCAVVSGAVDCWGSDEYGQLGNGFDSGSNNYTPTYSPAAVSGLPGKAVALAGGFGHTCALLADETLSCWGDNGSGQLGLGASSKPEYDTPQAVPSLANVAQVAVSKSHTCARLADATVDCWGDDQDGDLGDGGSTRQYSPVAVGLSGVSDVSLGGDDSCAVFSSGAVDCWGGNGNGQLGDASMTDSSTPVAVSGLTTAAAVSEASYASTCAILGDGSVDCWGNDTYEQLGHASPQANEDTPTPTQPLP